MTSLLIFVVAAAMALSLLVVVTTTPVHAFKTWNVNLHRVVDLPAKPTVNRTTITDAGECGYYKTMDGNNTSLLYRLQSLGESIKREALKDKAMGASDYITILAIPQSKKPPYILCGLEK